MTHSELVLVFPSAGISMYELGFSLPLGRGVPCGEDAGEEVEDRLRVKVWRVSCLRGVLGPSEPLVPLAEEPRAFALRSRVARSGLLAVPGERYIERRLVWYPVSGSSDRKSVDDDDDEGARLERMVGEEREEGPGPGWGLTTGEGVGGTMVGVAGILGLRGDGEEDVKEMEAFERSAPKLSTSGPSLRSTVPPARRACSKSSSVRETRLAAWGSLDPTA